MNNRKVAKEVANAVISYSKKSNSGEVLSVVGGLLAKAGKVHEAKVVVPRKLAKTEKVKTKKLVYKLTGENVKNINFYEDKKLLDGLKIFYKDKLWDFSLRSQIDSIVNL